MSWKQLDEIAQVLGYLLSLFALAPIFWSLVESAATLMAAKDLQKARRALVQFNLIKRTVKDTYQLHQLIRKFFSTKREQSALADDLKRGFCQVMVAVAKKIPEILTLEEIAAVNPTIPHLSEATTTQQEWLKDKDSGWPFFGLGRFYESQGVYDQAETWYEQCLSTTQNRLGEEHRDVATSLNNLAGVYHAQDRYNKAEPLYAQALALRKQRLGEEHPLVAISLNNLADLYSAQGRCNKAEPLYLQALEIAERKLATNHHYTVGFRENLQKLRDTRTS